MFFLAPAADKAIRPCGALLADKGGAYAFAMTGVGHAVFVGAGDFVKVVDPGRHAQAVFPGHLVASDRKSVV